jgi:hypothetical protein
MTSEQSFFDDLERRAEALLESPERDNEAVRHDLLIYPVLVSEFGLQWDPIDLISQSTISVPDEIANSHVFRSAVPRVRKPDILIFPKELARRIAVIEEKACQADMNSLNAHRLQLLEYQALYECTWGVLTDGEKWIIKKNFETFHEFKSMSELKSGIRDLRNSIGKPEVIGRILRHDTSDLVLIVNLFGSSDAAGGRNDCLEQYGFDDNIPVIIAGVAAGTLTTNGSGVELFGNLRAALMKYPDLHPHICTKRFTWAMKETSNGSLVRLRFETWPANEFYST